MAFPTRNILYLDTEATTYATGNPFSKPNRLMCAGIVFNSVPYYVDIEHSGLPYNGNLELLAQLLSQAELIVGFNIKYDLHWIRKYCPNVFPLVRQRVYCAQLGEFLLSHQRLPYPDLDTTLSYYGLPPKLDIVKSEYWNLGRDTHEVPADVLKEYVLRDVEYLPQIYEHQLKRFGNNINLMELQCEDLVVLQEMEYNGMLFDKEHSLEEAHKATEKLNEINDLLSGIVGHSEKINWDSPFHVSAVLYGGEVKFKQREKVVKTLKNGTTKESERTGVGSITFPRLVKPLTNTELKTPGYWSTDEPTLRSLRATGDGRKLIQLLLLQSELSKQITTYYKGIPALIEKMQWPDNMIHGQFNQVVARTGRLSSSKPNLQNFDRRMKHLFPSRFQ